MGFRSISMEPESHLRKPPMVLSIVVLPHPEGPKG